MDDMRDINKEEADKFAKENNYKYFETSAKTGEGVDNAIRELIIQILKQSNQMDDQKMARASSVQIKEENVDNSKKKKGCC